MWKVLNFLKNLPQKAENRVGFDAARVTKFQIRNTQTVSSITQDGVLPEFCQKRNTEGASSNTGGKSKKIWNWGLTKCGFDVIMYAWRK